METDDDNSSGHAWVCLIPRNGDPGSTHGELTQNYCHTWGWGAPSVTFTVTLGMVDVSVTNEESDLYWEKAARSSY